MAVNSFNAQNPPVNTKGDLFTFSTIPTKLGVGSNNTVLTADSTTATGLKWATPSATTPQFSLITSGSIASGTQLSITGLSSYDNIIVAFTGANCGTTGSNLRVRFNNDTSANYIRMGGEFYVNHNGATYTNTTVVPTNSSSQSFLQTGGYLSPGTQNSLTLSLMGCKSASGFTMGRMSGYYQSSTAIGEKTYTYEVGLGVNAALSSIQIYWGDGYTFTGGDYTVYGA